MDELTILRSSVSPQQAAVVTYYLELLKTHPSADFLIAHILTMTNDVIRRITHNEATAKDVPFFYELFSILCSHCDKENRLLAHQLDRLMALHAP